MKKKQGVSKLLKLINKTKKSGILSPGNIAEEQSELETTRAMIRAGVMQRKNKNGVSLTHSPNSVAANIFLTSKSAFDYTRIRDHKQLFPYFNNWLQHHDLYINKRYLELTYFLFYRTKDDVSIKHQLIYEFLENMELIKVKSAKNFRLIHCLRDHPKLQQLIEKDPAKKGYYWFNRELCEKIKADYKAETSNLKDASK